MFLRFSKGKQDGTRVYRKAVFLGDEVVFEYGNDIVGIAVKTNEDERNISYLILVAAENTLGATKIARYIKDIICRSNKFSNNPTNKRRRYEVKNICSASLPVRVGIAINELPNRK